MNSAFGVIGPRLDSPASVRRFLAAASLGCTLLLIYASLVPLTFRPLAWPEVLEAWRNIPWLSLGVFHRADWVANALVVLPAGILAAAAVDWGRVTNWQLLVASPLIAFGLALVVIGIELVQVWFPPRTVSLNDIAAGLIGAAVGPVLWAIGGKYFEEAITRFLTLPRFRDRLRWLCAMWIAGVVVYSVLPLDFVISRDEWRDRLTSGRIQLIPFAGPSGLASKFLDLLLSALRMVPVGVFIALRGGRTRLHWLLWALPIGLEVIQLPVYSKFVTGTAVLGGWGGGWLGYFLAQNLTRFERLIRRPIVWAIAWCAAFAAAAALLLLGAQERVVDPDLIQSRWNSAWSAPLVKYYAGSEYSAYTVMLEKLALFGAIGAACGGWTNTVSSRFRRGIFWPSMLAATLLGVAIEWIQVYLPPLVPDFSDALTYVAGYALGYVLLKILWGEA